MRVIALLVLVIPGFLAVLGIKLMRDMLFQVLHPPFPFLWMQFLSGLLLLVFGIWFISGFVFYRDRKNKKVEIHYETKPAPTGSNDKEQVDSTH
ncbi:Protein of unknown function [Alteribacillus persepolensis]|uniref:DUF2627 domain-containing protein n=1 Tax=Alteribacillus persepolensis TaxID=568899 RepID=A0A1G8D221_9BACI|nr:DUF2627 domain-containing protein [Alteribacillus persepolensis]SDH51776.1 Protein of unknown function [Alteribacillus persepolensis]